MTNSVLMTGREITIPFKDRFRVPMLNETKICTSRYSKYGEVGDSFTVFGQKFLLTDIGRLPLMTIRNTLYIEEGVSSPSEFQKIWKEIHPRRGFIREDLVWVHWFIKEEKYSWLIK